MSATWGNFEPRPLASKNFYKALVGLSLIAASIVWTETPAKPGYLGMDCASYVAAVNHHQRVGARDFFDGKAKGYTLLTDHMIFSAAEGDVAAFHGVHVAVFHSGEWYDSDPSHGGPGLMRYDAKDPWFHGAVKIFRRAQ